MQNQQLNLLELFYLSVKKFDNRRVKMSGLNERPADVEAGDRKREKNEKKQRSAIKVVMKVIIWILVIALLIFLTLFISARIAPQFDTMGDMLRYIFGQYSQP